MSALGRSIFYKIATKEDDYTQLLCNLMQRPEGRDFRVAVLEKLLGDRALASQIGSDHIRTQTAISGAGRPDLVIDAPIVCAAVEVKLNRHRQCTDYQLPPDDETLGGYIGFLRTAPSTRKILSFLVPGDWKYLQDTCDRLNDLQQCEGSIEIRLPVFWEEIFSLSKQYCTEPLHLEFWRLLGSDFGPVEFTQEEVNVLTNGVGVPARAVIKGEYLVDKVAEQCRGEFLVDQDKRNLFPAALKIIKMVQPRAVIIENVRGIMDAVFEDYRNFIAGQLEGYWTDWTLLNASDYGVPQLRPRVNFVAIRKGLEHGFSWPIPRSRKAPTVGKCLKSLMGANGWKKVNEWAEGASEIAPTLVGGSKKHGGPDLGPTRAKRAWAALGVDGMGLANEAPNANFKGMPRLTVEMTARIQGFPESWKFIGGKTAAYRQVGNAFPPPVASAVAMEVRKCLEASAQLQLAV